MVRCRSLVLVIALFCGLASAALGQGPPAPSDPVGSLKKEVDDAYAAFSKAYGHEPEQKVEASWSMGRYLDYQKKGDPGPDYREAERLFVTVVEKYADCPDLRKVGVRRARKTLGESANDELFEMRELAVGKPAPEITGEDLDGKPLTLSECRGKIVVLTFWASWCGPCMGMVPHERALVERMKGKPFALIGVNGDEDRGVARKMVESNGMSWRSFWNGGPNGPITDRWNVQGWPATYVLDPKGVIRFKQVREKKLDEAVDLLIKEVERGQSLAAE